MRRLVVAAVVATVAVVLLTALPAGSVAHNARTRQAVHRIHHVRRPTAHVAGCGSGCSVIANAYPGWVCDIQGGVVAAGIAILTDGASVVWSILGGSSWTAGCHAIDDMVLTSGQAAQLANDGRNCFFTWSKPHRQGIRREKCQYWYA